MTRRLSHPLAATDRERLAAGIRAMWLGGAVQREIAAHYGVSVETVRLALRAAGCIGDQRRGAGEVKP